jgi:hypothetical protein
MKGFTSLATDLVIHVLRYCVFEFVDAVRLLLVHKSWNQSLISSVLKKSVLVATARCPRMPYYWKFSVRIFHLITSSFFELQRTLAVLDHPLFEFELCLPLLCSSWDNFPPRQPQCVSFCNLRAERLILRNVSCLLSPTYLNYDVKFLKLEETCPACLRECFGVEEVEIVDSYFCDVHNLSQMYPNVRKLSMTSVETMAFFNLLPRLHTLHLPPRDSGHISNALNDFLWRRELRASELRILTCEACVFRVMRPFLNTSQLAQICMPYACLERNPLFFNKEYPVAHDVLYCSDLAGFSNLEQLIVRCVADKAVENLLFFCPRVQVNTS